MIITSCLAVTVSIAPVVMPTIPVPTWPVDTVDVRGAVLAAVTAPVGRVAALADAACESEAGMAAAASVDNFLNLIATLRSIGTETGTMLNVPLGC